MLNRRSLAVLCGLALSLSAGAALADHGHGMGPGRRLEKHLDELGLEPAQREVIQGLLDAARQERERHREEMRAAFQEMRALLDQDSPDQDAVMRQVERLGELRTEGHKAMLRTLLAVRAELTAEQRAQLRERMREDMSHQRRWRWHKGPESESGPQAP